jgi:regulator of sigma E protease
LALLRAGVEGGPLTVELADGRSVQLDAPSMQTDNLEQDTLRPLGIVRYDPIIKPVVGTVLPAGAAARAGVQVGDQLLAVDGKAVANWQGWVELIRKHPGKPLRIEYRRQGQLGALMLTPDAVSSWLARSASGPRSTKRYLPA